MKRIRLDWVFRMNKMCSFYGWEYIMRCFSLILSDLVFIVKT